MQLNLSETPFFVFKMGLNYTSPPGGRFADELKDNLCGPCPRVKPVLNVIHYVCDEGLIDDNHINRDGDSFFSEDDPGELKQTARPVA